MPHATPEQIAAFITRWQNSGAAERANYQMFLSELCDIIGVPRPDPTSPDPAKNLYVFDRAITRVNPDGTTTTKLLDQVKTSPHGFPVLVSGLWKEMATGTAYSALLFKEIACFNGGLFENTTALPLSTAQLAMLTDAAGTDWSAVEPSIFGTLLTRALDPRGSATNSARNTPRAPTSNASSGQSSMKN